MGSTQDELRSFASQRFQLSSELLLCLVTGAALALIAPQFDRAGPDLRTIFLAALVLHGGLLIGITPRLIPVLLFRCPRCTQHFHAASRGTRTRVALRRCAHCGIRVPRGDADPA